jgi:hypothetical protein
MRLSRRIWLIVVAVIIIAALAGLYSVYAKQAGERADLSDRLHRAQTLLPGLMDQRQDLEDELANAESLLNKSEAQFPDSVESIEYGEDLFEIAGDCGVEITKVTASAPANKPVGTITYSVSSFVVVVSGATENILDFIYAVRIGDDFQLPWSAEVKTVNLDVAGSTAAVSLDIYGYKG